MGPLLLGGILMLVAYILAAALIDRAQRPWKVRVTLHVCGLCDDGDEGDEDEVEPDTEPAAKAKARADVGVN
jgi:hypothetical protein